MMNNLMRRFWQDELGAEMVEWAVVTLILLVSTVAVLIALRDKLIELYQTVFTAIQQDPPDSY